jgi:acyl-CoA dehydrogenase
VDADFDLYRLTDEHEAVRDAVRAVCADKVAPHAADVDATGTFPQASYDALRAARRPDRRRTG